MIGAGVWADPESESKGELLDLYYIPRDEKFDQVKWSDFAAESVRGGTHSLIGALESDPVFEKEFESFDDIRKLYAKKGTNVDVPINLAPKSAAGANDKFLIPGQPQPLTFVHEWLFPTGPDTTLLKYPWPDAIAGTGMHALLDLHSGLVRKIYAQCS